MRNSLYWKLTLAFMLVAFITAAMIAVFIRVSSIDRLNRLIVDQQRENMEEALAAFYDYYGSWNGVGYVWDQLQFVTVPNAVQQGNNQFFYERERRALFGLADEDGRVIVSIDSKYPPGATLPGKELKKGTPVMVKGAAVGTILVASRSPSLNPAEALFLRRTNQALVLAMLSALVLALLIGLLLARNLARPLQALTRAAQNIAGGQLQQEVKVNSNDEIGHLATAFNQMSAEVARANLQRRQMTADIAHDLRTPLTVIGGYIEAMRDGVLTASPTRLALIYAEIERLQDLVGDLRTLSLADAGELPLNPQPIAPGVLLRRAEALFEHQAEQRKISLAVAAGDDLPEIRVDEARLMQVMDNLLSNAFRYTGENGHIRLAAEKSANGVTLSVRDDGAGIAPEDLAKVFDRFYRAEPSRHAESGESGLGLAIVRAIIEAHGGRVWAKSNPGKGTGIYMELPAA